MSPTSPHTCANCLRTFSSSPFGSGNTTYCCRQCEARHLCTCLTEVDLADDGVDGLGLPFGGAQVESFAVTSET